MNRRKHSDFLNNGTINWNCSYNVLLIDLSVEGAMGGVVQAIAREHRLAQQHMQLPTVAAAVVCTRRGRRSQRGFLDSDEPFHQRAGDGDAAHGHMPREEVAGTTRRGC